MEQLIQLSDNLEEKGKYIYKNNKHYRILATVMEHPEFREFYNQYMEDTDSLKTIIMFMKIYETVEKHSRIALTPYQKLSVVKEIIDNPEMRRNVCKGFSEWIENKPELRFSKKKRIEGASC